MHSKPAIAQYRHMFRNFTEPDLLTMAIKMKPTANYNLYDAICELINGHHIQQHGYYDDGDSTYRQDMHAQSWGEYEDNHDPDRWQRMERNISF